MPSLEDALYPLKSLYEAAPQVVKALAGGVYRSLPTAVRYGPGYEKFRQEAASVRHWTAAKIVDYQLQELNRSLEAAMRSPFYHARFRGLKLPVVSLTEFDEWPCITKQDLLVHREEMVNRDMPPHQGLFITTGGSSGVPVGFYLQRGVSRPKEQAYLEATWARAGHQPGDRVSVLRGSVTTSRAEGCISWYDPTRNWQILSSYHLTPDRIPEYLRALNRFRPEHIHAYPSALLMFARALEQLGLHLDFQPKSLLCGSEILTEHDQRWLEGFFSAPVIHWYGHSERAVLAAQTGPPHSTHLYFWPTYGLVQWGEEDENGLREIIATSFHNEMMPLVRYRTGDYALLPKEPLGELPYPEIERISGREHEFVESASGRKVSLTSLNMHDGVYEGLLAIQFCAHGPGKVEFHYQPGPKWNSARLAAIESALLRKLGDGFELSLKAVTEIQRTTAGKHRWLATLSADT